MDPSFNPHEESFEILLNRYLPKEFRDFIEGEFYQKVTQQSQLEVIKNNACLLYTSPSPRDATLSRMPSSA